MTAQLSTFAVPTRPRTGLSVIDLFLVLPIAVLPVIPMPIAGGTPFLLALISWLIVANVMFRKRIVFERTGTRFLLLALVLLALEAVTASIHGEARDFIYVAGRGLWILTSVAFLLALSPWVKAGQIEKLALLLSLSLGILLVAMLVESTFYPKRAFGRQLGYFNLPFPRATGVPNSDGKLGTFFCLVLAFHLFVRPAVPLWQRLILQFGPWAGLAFTQSRSTLLAMVACYGCFWLMRTFKERSFMPALIRVAGILAGLAIIFLIGGTILSNLIGEGIYQRNVESRFSHLDYGRDQVFEAPVFGTGAVNIREDVDKSGVHNTVIGMSIKSGVFAGALIAALLVFPLWGVRRHGKYIGLAAITSLGFLAEHMLYPGFINEFMMLGVLTVQASYNSFRDRN